MEDNYEGIDRLVRRRPNGARPARKVRVKTEWTKTVWTPVGCFVTWFKRHIVLRWPWWAAMKTGVDPGRRIMWVAAVVSSEVVKVASCLVLARPAPVPRYMPST